VPDYRAAINPGKMAILGVLRLEIGLFGTVNLAFFTVKLIEWLWPVSKCRQLTGIAWDKL
jgi:hypothetical protein